MPRVPTYDNFRAQPNTLPGAQFNLPAPALASGEQTRLATRQTLLAARQGQQAGQDLMSAGSTLGRVATKMQDDINQVALDAALNQLKENELDLTFGQDTGYTNLRGADALRRPDGQPLAEEYTSKLSKSASDIESNLGNEVQRMAFSRAAQGMVTRFRGRVQQHELQESRDYALSVSEGVQSTAMREIGARWNDPEAVENAVKRIQAHVYQQAKILGKSAEWQKAQARQMTSKAHRTAVAAALQNNHALYADAYLRKYADQMDADDLLWARSQVNDTVDLQVGDHAGSETYAQYAPKLAPSDFDRLANIVQGVESGGRRYGQDGKLLESPKGAKGEMQVLDGTNKSPGFGVRPAADDSPQERARVGRDYLAAMVKRYNGDLPKALAAYNWGPGNVDSAIKTDGDAWLSKAPAETRNYVASATAQYGAGAGAGEKPTLAEAKEALRARPELAGNPRRLKYAEARLESDWKDEQAAAKQHQDEALDAAYRALWANGGDLASLDPDIRMAIPGDKISSVMSFAEKVSKGGGAKQDAHAWAQIMSLPRETLAQMTPAQFYQKFRPVLDDAHLEKGYALIADAQGSPDAQHMEIISTAQRVKTAAMAAGIIPADGTKADEKQLKAMANFDREIDDRVRQYERVDLQGKRRANSEELQKIIDTVLMDKVNVSGYIFDDKDVLVSTLSEADLKDAYVNVDGESIKLSSIPVDQRARITEALRKHGRPVTEQSVASLWVAAGKPKE